MHSNALSRVILALACLFTLILPQIASGQGQYIPNRTVTGIVNGALRSIPGATITVCAANTSGLPCSPALANALFRDSALTQPLANPTTTDANGNYPTIAIGTGTYTVTETATGFSGYSYQISVPAGTPGTVVSSLAGPGSITGTFSGTPTYTGGATHSGPETFNTNAIVANAGIASAGPNALGGATTLPTGATFVKSDTGVFTNTQMNEYDQSLLNGCNSSTEYVANQVGNFATDAATGCITTPSTSTVHQTNAVAGYISNASTTTNAVGGYFAARALAANAKVWGINPVLADGGFNTTLQNEFDVVLSNASSTVNAGIALGFFGALNPANSNAWAVGAPLPTNTGKWANAFISADASAVSGLQLGAVAAVASSNGQPITLNARDAGNVTRNVSIQAGFVPAGANLNLATPTGSVAILNGVLGDAGGFKHKRFTSGLPAATAAADGAISTAVLSWGTAFTDSAYTVTCTGMAITGTPTLSISSRIAASVTVVVVAASAAASSYAEIDCIAVHD